MPSDDVFLKAGYYIRSYDSKDGQFNFYWLMAEEIRPSYIYKFEAVTTGADSGYKEVKDIKPPSGRFIQMLMGIQTACHIYVACPANVNLGGTDERRTESSSFRAIAYYNQRMSPFDDPQPITNMFFGKLETEQFYPWLKAYNPTSKTLVPRVRFVGKAFAVEKVTKPDVLDRLERRVIPWTPINMTNLEKRRD